MFVQARDEIKRLEDAHEEALKPIKEIKAKLEGRILEFLDVSGLTSGKTPYGTAIATVKDSASLADPDAFMNWVMKNGAFELLDRRANTTAVRDYVEEHGTLPPGVNFSSRKTASVRRS